jgi:MYXO-CTERM domain-containing protein
MKFERSLGLGALRQFRTRVIGFTFGALALALSLAHAGEARACGGCLVQQMESTQVTGHRMALSISPDATTLWDQISYSGAPESFAWVLPVKGLAEVALSSDALFALLDQSTTVQISSPRINCAPPVCPGRGTNDNAVPPAPAPADGGGVTVVARKTVGPYETVQLSSEDPDALAAWLGMNGYNIPSEIEPVIRAYVEEGFDFVALKLVPGEGISAMRPVRITVPGASLGLPLRMVAAGTGALTPITLWILGEGRYEPKNFSSFLIASQELVWDWDTQASNYKELRAERFDAADGKAWLVEAAEPLSPYAVRESLVSLARYDPQQSGYADENGEGAVEAAEADTTALLSSIPEQTLWISRLYGELPRSALASDLEVGAALDQSIVERFLQATQSTGTPPTCPPPPPGCEDPSGSSGPKPGSCAVNGRGDGTLALAGVLGLAALALRRRRRGRVVG